MWEHYRKTFIPTQLAIAMICLALNLKFGVATPALVVFVIVMEVFSVIGAMWATRLRRKVEHARSSAR
jgi:ABC-type transport system involved in Fe-S cluster assembly fused permease/ATPase subunit